MDSEIEHLFVYGTLRRGSTHPMARRLATAARHVGIGLLRGDLYDLGSFPGAALSPNSNGRIVGDLYALREPTALLDVLDRYENGDDPLDPLFRRISAEVKLAQGRQSVAAWIYVIEARASEPRILSGDWLAHRCVPGKAQGRIAVPDRRPV